MAILFILFLSFTIYIHVLYDIVSTGNFFAQICARRQMTDTTDSSVTVTDEIDSYLLDKSYELSSINHYPHLKRLYVSLNTTLPSTAARDTLFTWRPSVHTLAFSTQQ